MKCCVIVFPASNCDRDVAVALETVTGHAPRMVWHGDRHLPANPDLIVIPGGFSHGDYLRAGAMAAHAPIMRDVIKRARAGTPVLGICNGFQILTETGLLPGALMRNASLKFVCGLQSLCVANTSSIFTRGLEMGSYMAFPVAHHDGNYTADKETLDRLEGGGQIAFTYVTNPNGSARNIAGIVNETGTILGLMPHPERVISALLGGVDGDRFFRNAIESIAA